ncbi:MAG: FAD-binding oxidoreductase [Actinomycetota bacterium]
MPATEADATMATLTGWGRTAPSVGRVVVLDGDTVRSTPDSVLPSDLGRGAIPRGLGRSYGDPAQNGGGAVLRLLPGRTPITLDERAGTATVDAGVSFDDLLRTIVPTGFFVPVTPGTRFITVGGAIASDIHGKNHHVDGTFGAHCRRLTLLTAAGALRSISPADGAVWWATIGGMGLTGLIVDATFDLIPIETSRCLVRTQRVANLDALIDTMAVDDQRYSVAWVDLLATGRSLGRAVLTRADHARLDDLPPKARRDPLAFSPPALLDVPPGGPNVLSRPAVRAFNELWYRKAPRDHTAPESITGFFHPLDMVGSWNRLYGGSGFLQYQFVVPDDRVDSLRLIIERVVASGHASFLAVLKRFGPANAAMLSFPTSGWTLTLDVPAGASGLADLLRTLDDVVLDAGGRHYLAKDAHATPAMVRAGYPRLAEWQAARRAVDPDGYWISDQARRLGLLDEEVA